ncbi:MAG: TMAO reductase system sensor histidine kinase/response regulator TorS [Halofilum sp. (in: g-proteobacteria)]
MLRRQGIGARLLLAFIAVALLGLIASAVGWFMLRDLANNQEIVTNRALPAVSKAEAVARISAQMVAAAPALTSATTQEGRERRAQDLFGDTGELRRHLADLRQAPLDREAIDSLETTADKLIENLNLQNDLVAQRLRLAHTAERAASQAIEAATGITELSEALVANAKSRATAVIANMYGLIETPSDSERAFGALDRLAEVDLYLMERMFALRMRSAQVAYLIDQLRGAGSQAVVDSLHRRVSEHLRVLERRVESVPDPVRRGQAANLMANLSRADGSQAGDNVFELRRQIIDVRAQTASLGAENLHLAQQLDRQATALVSQARVFADHAADNARQASSYGLWGIVAASGVSLLLSALIVWLYVQRNIARRLDGLASAMRSLAGGDLSVTIAPDGRDEIADMARAVAVFHDDAVRRRTLESERDAVEQELRAHREELQRQVSERTAELSTANESLKREIAEHERARAAAERASRAKSEFLATVSHEIRTPMSGMLGMLRVLHDSDEAPLGDAQRERLELVQSSAQTLLSILNGILDYSKAEAGQIDLEEINFDVSELLNELVALMRPSAEEKGLILRAECRHDVPDWLYGDAAKLRQVLFNLVSNATKFTDAGEIVLRAGMESADKNGQLVVHFEVTDTGLGLHPEEESQIFQPFHQTSDVRRDNRGGTGLGLAIAQRLVEPMGGTIAVESSLGEGSRFYFGLAFRPGQQDFGRTSTMVEHHEQVPPKRVLVVEDDEVHRVVVTTFLEQLGHTVDQVHDGEQALEHARRQLPDAVLVDVSLPGIDGLTTVRLLREQSGRRLPAIAMSAHVFREEIHSYRRAGMDAVIIKPVWPETINSGLRAALSSRRLEVVAPTPENESRDDHAERSSVLDSAVLNADEQALGTATVDQMIALFRESAGEHVERIQEAARWHDCAALARSAHELKSAAQSLGLHALGQRCAAAEGAARHERRDDLAAHATEVAEAHAEAEAALAAYCANRVNGG